MRGFGDFQSSIAGVTLIEHAVITGLVAIVAITPFSAIGGKLKRPFSTVNSSLTPRRAIACAGVDTRFSVAARI